MRTCLIAAVLLNALPCFSHAGQPLVFAADAPNNAAEGLSAEASMVGVNLAGGEFGRMPGVYGRDYVYPGAAQFDYCKAKGLTIVRLPFRWERLQPKLSAPLDEAELTRLDETVRSARDRGIKLLLDSHNYARYHDHVIGTPEVPNAAFADFWNRIAAHYRDEAAVFAYGLTNEPHDTGGLWPAAAQAAIDGIRLVDRRHTISVCGDGWSGAHSWKSVNKDLLLKDPANKLLYEAHQYFDRDHSGSYRQTYDDAGAGPDVGVKRLQPFVEWLQEHNARGFVGEFGVPDKDPRWLEVLDNFLAAMKANHLGGTYWAAGPWWGDYPQSVEPRQGKDRPQMEVLELYAGSRIKPKDAKTSYADADAAAKAKALARRRSPPAKPLPPGATKLVYDLGTRPESYHYSNPESEFASTAAEESSRKMRRITYRHHGSIAWVGAGLYFGGLDCNGYTAFRLAVRAEKPCKLSVKAYHADDAKFEGTLSVGTEWQELVIPFDRLKSSGESFDSTRGLWKIEFQPNPDHNGNRLDLGEFRLLSQ